MAMSALRITFLLLGMLVACSGCALIGLPFEVTEDALEGTEMVVEDVEDAI